MKFRSFIGLVSISLIASAAAVGCGAGDGSGDGDGDSKNGIDLGNGDGDGDTGGDGDGITLGDGDGTAPGDVDDENPATCDIAAQNRTYVGCEFWPTITYNPLYSEFDFAVVIANGGTEDATVTVNGGALGADIVETIPAGGLKAIKLPWVSDLKGPEFMKNTSGGRVDSSVLSTGGAYKVSSTVPVTAWQFNPLQYKKPVGEFGERCGTTFGTADCFSASNDASLLVPTAAMTGNYRVYTRSEVQSVNGGYNSTPGGMAITATQDGTAVTIEYGPNCKAGMTGGCTAAGTGVSAKSAGEQDVFNLNAGDVLQILGAAGMFEGDAHADVSGSLVNATKPVQIIGFNPITNVPNALAANADHIEELILPGEVIGKEYIVAPPTSPSGVVKGGHVVRIFGNVDGTALTYDVKPAGAPDTIDAGQVVELAVTTTGFKVTGTESFAVSSVMLGGSLQGDGVCPNYPCTGDPAMSMMVSPKQFRSRYTFLAPADYDVNFADVLVPAGAIASIDGVQLGAGEPIGATGWSVVRHALDNSGGGSHKLESDMPVGLQVMGFGHATSYYYPGGLNLKIISEPVVIVVK